MEGKSKLFSTQNVVKIGLLGALAVVLMRVLEIPLPIFPAFLKIDFGDIPAVIATLVVHPVAGVLVVIIKNILALLNSSSGGIGEIVNAAVGISFVLPIGLLCRKNTQLKNVILGSLLGIALMIAAGVITNAFVTMPLYGEEACIGMGNAINPLVVDKVTFLLYIMVPFNALKGALVAIVSAIVVKAMTPIFKYLKTSQVAH